MEETHRYGLGPSPTARLRIFPSVPQNTTATCREAKALAQRVSCMLKQNILHWPYSHAKHAETLDLSMVDDKWRGCMKRDVGKS
jgi:hypothetical protein